MPGNLQHHEHHGCTVPHCRGHCPNCLPLWGSLQGLGLVASGCRVRLSYSPAAVPFGVANIPPVATDPPAAMCCPEEANEATACQWPTTASSGVWPALTGLGLSSCHLPLPSQTPLQGLGWSTQWLGHRRDPGDLGEWAPLPSGTPPPGPGTAS